MARQDSETGQQLAKQLGDGAAADHDDATPTPATSPRLVEGWSSEARADETQPSRCAEDKPPREDKTPVVLLVEDDSDRAGRLRESLERGGYRIAEGSEGEEGLMIIPISKSSSPSELMACIRKVMRNWSPDLSDQSLSFEDIFMDLVAHRVRRGTRDVHLGPTEFRLLRHLMESPGDVFSRQQLLDAAWGPNVYVEPRTVDVHIRRMRMALNGQNEPAPSLTDGRLALASGAPTECFSPAMNET